MPLGDAQELVKQLPRGNRHACVDVGVPREEGVQAAGRLLRETVADARQKARDVARRLCGRAGLDQRPGLGDEDVVGVEREGCAQAGLLDPPL